MCQLYCNSLYQYPLISVQLHLSVPLVVVMYQIQNEKALLVSNMKKKSSKIFDGALFIQTNVFFFNTYLGVFCMCSSKSCSLP